MAKESMAILRSMHTHAQFLILALANYVYQIPLISHIGDAHLQGKTFSFPFFPSVIH